MRRTHLSVLAVAALGLAFAPVTTADEGHEQAGYHHDAEDPDSVYFVESQAWYTVAGPTGVGNVDSEQGVSISWSDAEPAAGPGGVTVANGTTGLRAIVDESEFSKGQLVAEGTVTGLLDSITLDLHFDDLGGTTPFCAVSVAVDVTYDGIPVLDMDNHLNTVDVTTTPTENGGVAQITIVDIHEKLLAFSGSGFDFIGDETTEHTVRIDVTQYPICTEVVWRYDTADFPTSIRFNHDPSSDDVSGHTVFSVVSPPAAS